MFAHLLERLRQGLQLRRAQALGEVAADSVPVVAAGGLQGSAALVGDRDEHDPAVVLFHRSHAEGKSFWGPGDLYTFLVTGEESAGAYFSILAVVPPEGFEEPSSVPTT